MDFNSMIQVISTLGFPIACVIFMAWRDMKHEETDRAEREKTNGMLLDFSKNIQENTLLLKALADLIKENKRDDE